MHKQFPLIEIIAPIDEQTVINPVLNQDPNTITLKKNNDLIEIGADHDYVIDETNQIVLNQMLSSLDIVSLQYTFTNLYDVELFSKNQHNPRLLFKPFSQNQKLYPNQTYTLKLALKTQTIESTFQTAFNPFYSNINKIRIDGGDLFSDVTDEQISLLIYLNSKMAKSLQLEVLTTAALETGETVDSENVQITEAMRQYARYKTDLDLTNAIYMSMTGQYGTVNKQIGELQIQKEIKLPEIDKMLKRFKELFSLYDKALSGANGAPVAFVKAVTNNAYTTRGTF